jgi:hypothetical protein
MKTGRSLGWLFMNVHIRFLWAPASLQSSNFLESTNWEWELMTVRCWISRFGGARWRSIAYTAEKALTGRPVPIFALIFHSCQSMCGHRFGFFRDWYSDLFKDWVWGWIEGWLHSLQLFLTLTSSAYSENKAWSSCRSMIRGKQRRAYT